jgi:hypothetical protein
MNRRDAKALAKVVVCFLIEGQQGVGWDYPAEWPEKDRLRFDDALDALSQQLYNAGGEKGAALYRELWIR